tara:strand:- start:405 stop:611 length:207 start_codon:yes stop_codon:yes gene_type:complete
LNKKTIVFLLVLALVAVACATDTATEEVAVEEENAKDLHLKMFKNVDSLSVVFLVLQLLSLRHKLMVL